MNVVLLSFCYLEADDLCVFQHTGSSEKAEKEAEKEIEAKINEITAAGEKSRQTVIDDLLKAVTTVNPQVHKNAVKK